MKASTFLVVTSCLLGCGVESFSLSPERAVSRREVSKAIISGGASCLIAGTTVPLPALAEEGEYITTDRGIKYKVVKEADPSSPTPVRGQKVKAIYTLYLNGFPEDTAQAKKVDSSTGPFGEKPFEFFAGVSKVIKGWDLTILDMRVGEARKLIVPADLGYGDYGVSGIPGGANLYFNLELVDVGLVPKLNDDQEKWLADNPL